MSKQIHIELPKEVKNIINTIIEAGYEAYAVGGSIRDCLIGRKPGDYDITTSAMPSDIKRLFRRTIDTGIEHGTVTVMIGDTGYEITTYRIDGKYEDSRHPKEVVFTRSLTEDLRRRDFTINAMAYNDEAGLVDPFNGQADLKDHIIRCVGDPMERLSEDALRIMRAVRFSAQLDYEIDEETKKAIYALAPNLKNISEERIEVELVKLVTSDHPEKLKDAYEMGITHVFMPEFDVVMKCEQNNPHHFLSVGEHTLLSMQNVENDKYLRLGMLFHDFGKPECKTTDEEGINHFHGHPLVSKKMAQNILRRLKFDNQTIQVVSKLVEYHDLDIDPTRKGVRHAINKVGEDIFPMVLKVKRADLMAQSDYMREEKIGKLDKIEEVYEEVKKLNECVSLKTLAVNGGDLIKEGFPSSPVLGKELQKLLLMVIDDPSLNQRETLLELAKEDLSNV